MGTRPTPLDIAQLAVIELKKASLLYAVVIVSGDRLASDAESMPLCF
jgi:hypothetical protein